jgi:hypothetical protein
MMVWRVQIVETVVIVRARNGGEACDLAWGAAGPAPDWVSAEPLRPYGPVGVLAEDSSGEECVR